jgi:hypothetical protein
MADDIDQFFTDLSKTTRQLESWQVNATERFLAAGASSVRNAVTRVTTNTNTPSTIVEGQWLRKISLIVYQGLSNDKIGNIPPGKTAIAVGSAGSAAGAAIANKFEKGGDQGAEGIDLSELRIVFRVKKATVDTPNLLEARVYNLAPDTIKKVRQYKRVQLAAGYESNYGMIFDGIVVLYIVGKENSVDSYLDIRAGDQSQYRTNAAVGMTWPAGATQEQKAKDMVKAAGGEIGEIALGKAGAVKSLRSSSYIGMLTEGIRDITNATKSNAYVDDGKVYIISWNGYRKNQIVELATDTGLVNIPKVTPQGIEAECLLNPKLRLDSLVRIKSGLISDIPYEPGAKNPFANSEGIVPGSAEGNPMFTYPAAAMNNTEEGKRGAGVYKIMLLDHRGDSRGEAWYSYIVCAAAGEDGTLLDTTNAGTAYERHAHQ